ncbi:MAG: hypothetical protein GY774_01625 [Planctomycetes bacterium]|nr:hypothetical protein [Planctomycetota bacterium]
MSREIRIDGIGRRPMKFDVVAQWVIVYDRQVIYPFAGLAVALGRMVLTSYNSLQSLLWH